MVPLQHGRELSSDVVGASGAGRQWVQYHGRRGGQWRGHGDGGGEKEREREREREAEVKDTERETTGRASRERLPLQ